MDQVKKYLEAYVQWLALALGVGFLGWMVWSYVLQKPVSSPVGTNTSASPGEINGIIWNDVGQRLDSAVKDHTLPQGGIGPKDDYSNEVAKLFQSASLVAGVFQSPWTPISRIAEGSTVVLPGPSNGGTKIAKLPEVPPLTDLQVSHGHSNVPAPQPAGAAGGEAPKTQQQAVDRNWQTIAGKFPTVALAKSFKDVGIEPGKAISTIAVLRVVLVRQERNADGTWPRDDVFTEVPPLDINPLPALPDLASPVDVQIDYLQNFADKNFTLIARPPFYQVLQGDVWYEPGTPNPKDVQEVVDNGFNPLNPGAFTGDPSTLLPQERTAYEQAKKEQAAKDALKNHNQNTPRGNANTPSPPGMPGGYPGNGGAGGGGTGRGGRGSGNVVDDPMRLAGDFGNPMVPPGFPGGYPGGYPGYGGPRAPMMPQAQSGQAAAENVPAGEFDPSQQPEFKVWAHDVTVQAGKSYRYKIKYIISNPLWRTTNLCSPDLSKQFSIESQFSAWTGPVNVESDTNFYAVDNKHGIEFDVFKWKDGIWQMQDVTANPGDMIGGAITDPTTGAKTDFTTGWTLVDSREDPADSSNRILVLVSENGTVLQKELKLDQHDPGFRKLWRQVNQNKPAMAAMPANPNP